MGRNIPPKVSEVIFERSNGYCECCGSFAGQDRHHILEYHLGGPHTPENLLVVCPRCHRLLPKILSIDQQMLLKSWHNQNGGGSNISANAQLKTLIPSLDMGTILFKNVKNILRVGDQNIITIREDISGLYLNVIMIDDAFSPKILILGNTVIVNGGFQINVSQNSISVSDSFENWFKIYKDEILTIRGKVKYKNETLEFSDDHLRFRGIDIAYLQIDCANQDYTAFTIQDEYSEFDFGAKIRILNKNDS